MSFFRNHDAVCIKGEAIVAKRKPPDVALGVLTEDSKVKI